MGDTSSALGNCAAFRVGNKVVDIYPVRLKDWPEFVPALFAFEMENLHEIHYFSDLAEAFFSGLRIVTRTSSEQALSDIFDDIEQSHYSELRKLIIQQNDLNFERLREKINNISKGAPDKGKKQ